MQQLKLIWGVSKNAGENRKREGEKKLKLINEEVNEKETETGDGESKDEEERRIYMKTIFLPLTVS